MTVAGLSVIANTLLTRPVSAPGAA